MAFKIIKPTKLTRWEKFWNLFHNLTTIRHSMGLEKIIDAHNEERAFLIEDINDCCMLIFKLQNDEPLTYGEKNRIKRIQRNIERERIQCKPN